MSVFGEKIEDYEILEHLGKGGFAHVYRARCHRTGIFVAIKMIDKALMANAGMIGRVRQEVTIHSRLKHPAILELYTFFEDAHYVYLVLELAHNGELAKHFKLRTLGLSEKAAADIFKQVVSGVLYLHTHNIIHRDLSLNNLLLTKDLNVKIADFGLATQLSEPDEKHVTMCGTPNYISPEVASREMHGLPADVWGLGCMLFTLLVGSPPFHTQHVKTTLNKVINADYKIPSNLSFYAQDLLQKLLCKDPKKRITLKGIMDHPFLQDHNITNTGKPDLSRDSGFLTTLHSTQHSNKIRNENNLDSNYLVNGSENNIANFIGKEECKVGLFNVFSGLQSNELQSHHSNGCNSYNICSNKDKPLSVLTTRHTPIQKFDSACNTNSLIESVKNLCTRSDNIPSTITPQENKENISKVCKSDTLGVPPLCAERLPTISHRTRNAILKIESFGVIVEFIKKRGRDREEKIVEICEISKDGMKILIYSFDNVKDNVICNSTDKPSPNEIFSYHNLPQKHWKKYLYAARFVDLVKAKTPKITLYSSLGKCQLMENGTDIDLFFYNGEKVTYSASEGLKIIDKNSKTHYDNSGILELKNLVEHFEDCSNRIKRVQDALSTISDECFPLIIGKRPVPPSSPAPVPNQAQNYNTPTFNIGSFHRTIAASSQAQSDYNVT